MNDAFVSAKDHKSQLLPSQSWAKRLAGFLWGYDFFISYAHSDAGHYAEALADQLYENGFECFLDRKSFAKGDNWLSASRRALKKTERLVVLVSPAALTSQPVIHEIKSFVGKKERVIPIDFGVLSNRDAYQSELFEYISAEYLWIPESSDKLDTTTTEARAPADHVISDLCNTFQLETQYKKRLRWVTRTAGVLLALSIIVFCLFVRAEYLRIVAETSENDAIESQKRAQDNEQLAQEKSRQFQRELAISEASLGVQARDQHNDCRLAAHRFLRAAKYAQSSGDDHLAYNFADAATPLLKQHHRSFPSNGQIAFSHLAANGSLVCIGEYNGSIRIWNIEKHSPLWTYEHTGLEGGVVNHVANQLVTWGTERNESTPSIKHVQQTSVRVWNLESGEMLQDFLCSASTDITLHAETSRLLSRTKGEQPCVVNLWDLKSGKLITKLEGHISHTFFDNQGLVVTISDTISFWSGFDSQPLSVFPIEQPDLYVKKYQSGRALWATDNSGTLHLWDGHASEHKEFPAQRNNRGGILHVTDIALLDQNQLLVFYYDGSVRIWEIESGNLMHATVLYPTAPFSSLSTYARLTGHSILPDKRHMVTWSYNQAAHLWKIPEFHLIHKFQHSKSVWNDLIGDGNVQGCTVTKDGRTAITYGDDGTFREWDTTTGQLRDIFGHATPRHKPELTNNQSKMLTYTSSSVELEPATIWNLNSEQEIKSNVLKKQFWGANFSEDSQAFITWSQPTTDGGPWSTNVWSLSKGQLVPKDSSPSVSIENWPDNEKIDDGKLYQNGELLLLWSKSFIQLRDVKSGIVQFENKTTGLLGATVHAGSVYTAIVNYDATNNSHRLSILKNNKQIASFGPSPFDFGYPVGVAMNSDASRFIYFGSTPQIKIAYLTPSEIIRVTYHTNIINGAAFLNDESQIMSWSGDGWVKIWDIRTEVLRIGFKVGPPVLYAALNEEESQLVTVDNQGGIILWCVYTGLPLCRYHLHNAKIARIVNDNLLTRVTALASDGSSITFPISPNDNLSFADRLSTFEVESGSTLSNAGQLGMMTFDEWLEASRNNNGELTLP